MATASHPYPTAGDESSRSLAQLLARARTALLTPTQLGDLFPPIDIDGGEGGPEPQTARPLPLLSQSHSSSSRTAWSIGQQDESLAATLRASPVEERPGPAAAASRDATPQLSSTLHPQHSNSSGSTGNSGSAASASLPLSLSDPSSQRAPTPSPSATPTATTFSGAAADSVPVPRDSSIRAAAAAAAAESMRSFLGGSGSGHVHLSRFDNDAWTRRGGARDGGGGGRDDDLATLESDSDFQEEQSSSRRSSVVRSATPASTAMLQPQAYGQQQPHPENHAEAAADAAAAQSAIASTASSRRPSFSQTGVSRVEPHPQGAGSAVEPVTAHPHGNAHHDSRHASPSAARYNSYPHPQHRASALSSTVHMTPLPSPGAVGRAFAARTLEATPAFPSFGGGRFMQASPVGLAASVASSSWSLQAVQPSSPVAAITATAASSSASASTSTSSLSAAYQAHLSQLDRESPRSSQQHQQQELQQQVASQARELDALALHVAHLEEQHARELELAAARAAQSLTAANHAHELEMRQMSLRADSLQQALEQQVTALEAARQEAASRDQTLRQRQADHVALEAQRDQLVRELQSRELSVQKREGEIEALVAQAKQAQLDAEARLAKQHAESKLAGEKALQDREQELRVEFAQREGSLQNQLDQTCAALKEIESSFSSRRAELEAEWVERDRQALARHAEREAELAKQFDEKRRALESERVHALEVVHQQQASIDAGNQSKLQQILGQYKSRIAALEGENLTLSQSLMHLQKSLLLERESGRQKRSGIEGMLGEYQALVQEQSAQLELQKAAIEAHESEVGRVSATYEQLIGRLGEAENIKMRAVQAELAQLKPVLAERDSLRTQLSDSQRALHDLQLEHSRLSASQRLLADSKAMAEGEVQRVQLENRRLADELGRVQLVLYGHKGHTGSGGGVRAGVGAAATSKTASTSAMDTSKRGAKVGRSATGAAGASTLANSHSFAAAERDGQLHSLAHSKR